MDTLRRRWLAILGSLTAVAVAWKLLRRWQKPATTNYIDKPTLIRMISFCQHLLILIKASRREYIESRLLTHPMAEEELSEEELQERKVFLPASLFVIDEDALVQNIYNVKRLIQHRNRLCPQPTWVRIVVKSLPSYDFVSWLMATERLGSVSSGLMIFHVDHMLDFVTQVEWQHKDILVGRPFSTHECIYLIEGMKEFYRKNQLEGSQNQWIRERLVLIQFLVDSKERLQEYIQLAVDENVSLRITLEVDVGLHRGGIDSLEELRHVLNCFVDCEEIGFAGLLGYDGHVTHSPQLFSEDKEACVAAAFSKSLTDYRAFIQETKNVISEWKAAGKQVVVEDYLTFNSGGSTTFHEYANEQHTHVSEHVNDLSLGSLLWKPANFDHVPYLVPCAYIASEVIKQSHVRRATSVPFVPKPLWRLITSWYGYVRNAWIAGGSYHSKPFYPLRTSENVIIGLPNSKNMNPTLALVQVGSSKPPKDEEETFDQDFVILRPNEADACTVFKNIISLVRTHPQEAEEEELEDLKVSCIWPVYPATAT